MTTTYDPGHVDYLDEADVRGELARAFDVCRECRRCVELCTAFPTLFDLLDRQRDPSAGYMTPADQDDVVSSCHHCSLCSIGCPYTPERHDASVDMPRLMLRATAMRHAHRLTPVRVRVADKVMGKVAGRSGPLGSAMAPVADRVAASAPGSPLRRVAGAIAGVSTVRMLPPAARERFSTWFRRRPKVTFGHRQGNVTVFATCLVEHREPGIGQDLVKVYPTPPVGGPAYLSVVRQPLGDIPMLVGGGYGIDEIPDYRAVGATAFGIGSPLLGADDEESLAKIARALEMARS